MVISVILFSVIGFALMCLLSPRPTHVRARAEYDLPEPHETPGRMRYSLLVAALREPELSLTFADLISARRQDFEVLLLVHPDDELTMPQAQELERANPQRFRVIEVHSSPSSLATDLNAAIPHCAGELIGVLDVGDPVRASLLDRVDGAFRASEADVVRVAMDIPDDARGPEIADRIEGLVLVRGTLPVRVTERFWQGRSAACFVRTDLVRLLGGWDDDSPTEELELMLRLFSYGATGALLYGETARRPAPGHESYFYGQGLGMLYRRRIRWYTSLIQIYRTGEWRRLPDRRGRWAARHALLLPIVRSQFGAGLPLLLLGAGFLLGVYPALTIVVSCVALNQFVVSHAVAVAWLRHEYLASRRRARGPLSDPQVVLLIARMLTTLLLDVVTQPLALSASLRRHLRGDTRVLSAHFERSLRKPPPRRRVPAPPPEPDETDHPEPPTGDLLAVAESPDTPEAAKSLATGLDTLFRTLGPPPEALRLAHKGPTQGDGGSTDG